MSKGKMGRRKKSKDPGDCVSRCLRVILTDQDARWPET